MRRSSLLLSLVMLVLVGQVAAGRPSSAHTDEGAMMDHPLVGSWLVAVTLESQDPGAPLPSELTSLVTYFSDGNVLVANAGHLPPLPPGSGLFFTEGHGEWVTTGAATAEATVVSLVLDQTGALADTNTLRTTVEVDETGDAYTGAFTIETVSTTGTTTELQNGTFSATRIEAVPVGTPAATPQAVTGADRPA